MLCRVLVTAIAISYLICVLWLSGLQKEDLDVNMLRKLRRHNINIDEMNRESMRRECLELENKNKSTTINAGGNETTVAVTTNNGRRNNDKIQETVLSDFDESIISDTKSENKTIKESKESTLKPIEDQSNQNISTDAYTTDGFTLSTKYGVNNTHDENNNTDKRQRNLQKVMDFWKIFTATRKPMTIQTTEKIPNDQPNANKDDRDKHIKEPDYFSKLLESFIHETRKLSTTTPAPQLDLTKLSQQIEKILNLLPESIKDKDSKSLIITSEVTPKLDETYPSLNRFIEGDIPSKTMLLSERLKQYINNPVLLDPLNDTQYVEDILIEAPKIYSVGLNKTNVMQVWTNLGEKNESRPTHTIITKTRDINSNTTEDIKLISKEVIKEIAEDIKAQVLKDLRPSLTSNTVSMTSNPPIVNITTTTNITTSAAVATTQATVNKTQDATQMISKFMAFLEQFKTIQEKADKTVVKGKFKVKVSNKKSMPAYKNPFNIESSAPILIVDSREPGNLVKMPPVQYSSLQNQNMPIIHLPLTSANVVQYNAKSYVQPKFKTMDTPITIQTNSGEIPPLNIPIHKPLKLVHQNIVVTTPHPVTSTGIRTNDKWAQVNKKENNYKDLTRVPPSLTVQFTTDTKVRPQTYSNKLNAPVPRSYNIEKHRHVENMRQPQFGNEKAKLSEQRSYRSAQTSYIVSNNLTTRVEDQQQKTFEQKSDKLANSRNQDGDVQLHYDEGKSKSSEPKAYNLRILNQDDRDIPSWIDDEKKLLDQTQYKTITDKDKNENLHNLKEESLKPADQRFYKFSTSRNDERSLPRFENKNMKLLKESSYKSARGPNQENQHSSQFESERLKSLEQSTSTSITNQMDHRLYQFEDEKFEENRYKSGVLANQEVGSRQPGYENDKIKSKEQSSYKSGRLRNQEDGNRQLGFENDRTKSIEQSRYKTTRSSNEGESLRGHPRFNDQKYKSLENSYKITRSRSQESIYRPPIRFEDDKIKSLERTHHFINKKITSQDDNPSARFEKKLEHVPYKSIRTKHQDSIRGSLRVENGKQSLPPSHFESLRNTKREENNPSSFFDERNLSQQTLYKNARNRIREDNRPPRFEDILSGKPNNNYMDRSNGLTEMERKLYPRDRISFGSFRSHNRERFHNKFERVDGWHDQELLNKRKELTLASRHQQPLNNLKKPSAYDDTHFKNFLKTQQKVNDMLEQILSSKTSYVDPRSVEIV